MPAQPPAASVTPADASDPASLDGVGVVHPPRHPPTMEVNVGEAPRARVVSKVQPRAMRGRSLVLKGLPRCVAACRPASHAAAPLPVGPWNRQAPALRCGGPLALARPVAARKAPGGGQRWPATVKPHHAVAALPVSWARVSPFLSRERGDESWAARTRARPAPPALRRTIASPPHVPSAHVPPVRPRRLARCFPHTPRYTRFLVRSAGTRCVRRTVVSPPTAAAHRPTRCTRGHRDDGPAGGAQSATPRAGMP